MIKVIIFDLGGVVKKGSFTLSFLKEMKKAVKIEEKAIRESLRKFLPAFEKGKTNEKEFYSKLAFQLKIKPTLIKRIWKEAHEKLKINSEVIKLINSLKQKDYKVAVLSNINPPHARTISKQVDFKIFDAVFFSYKIGMRKPEKGIYEFVLRKLKLSPEECIFIDDKVEHLKPAKGLGIKTILFTSPKQLKRELSNFL